MRTRLDRITRLFNYSTEQQTGHRFTLQHLIARYFSLSYK